MSDPLPPRSKRVWSVDHAGSAVATVIEQVYVNRVSDLVDRMQQIVTPAVRLV